MLTDRKVVAFAAASNPERARAFYGDTLGLKLVSEQLPFAFVFDCAGTMLRVTMVKEVVPAPYTVLGWEVPDIVDSVTQLAARGVEFRRYEGLPQDDLGVWASPGGARGAWFQDPDGNVLSLTQF